MKAFLLLSVFSISALAGTNGLVTVTGGRVQIGDVNQYGSALKQDLVPRNAIGTVTDLGGSLGDSTHRWDSLYARTLNIGNIGTPLFFSAAGVNGAYLQDNTVTRAKLVAVGQQISSSSGAFATTSTSYVDVTNLSVTITTVGRPVRVFAQPAAAVGSEATYACVGNTNTLCALTITRDGTSLYPVSIGSSAASITTNMSPSSVMYIDSPSAGSHTYKLQGLRQSTATRLEVNNISLVAHEL